MHRWRWMLARTRLLLAAVAIPACEHGASGPVVDAEAMITVAPSPGGIAPAVATRRTPCRTADARAPERMVLGPNTAARAASGIEAHFVGFSWDHDDDGTFEQLGEFRFDWDGKQATRIISVLAKAPDYDPVLGHCWRFVETHGDGAKIDIGIDLLEAQNTPLPQCTAAQASPAVFDDYAAASPGAVFQASIRYADAQHDWVVSPTPKRLLHHATRIDWENLSHWGAQGLGQARGSEVRIVFHFVSSEVQQMPAERGWTSRHVAAIDSACAL